GPGGFESGFTSGLVYVPGFIGLIKGTVVIGVVTSFSVVEDFDSTLKIDRREEADKGATTP
ncbi:hypothetical protein C5167_038392, partial [Papaver somniferum]